jgi:hypothetical protein
MSVMLLHFLLASAWASHFVLLQLASCEVFTPENVILLSHFDSYAWQNHVAADPIGMSCGTDGMCTHW